MKIEKLRNKKSYKWFLCGLILVVILTISYRVSKANYRISNSIELTTGKVISSPYDFNIVSMYIDGVEQDKDAIIPDASLYEIDEENSYCCKTTPCKKENKDSNVTLKTKGGSHTFSGISKGSKCNLAFKQIEARTMSELLDNYYIYKLERTSKNKDFNVPFGDDTKQTVYIAPDDEGLSYYFAGNPLDNWVEFGGYYWRIIRVNGDGSIRLIYHGTERIANGIGTSSFNSNNSDNTYVGFMYGTPNSSTYEETHANINDSTIKQVLDNWFVSSNIKQGTEYFNKIDINAGFCGDRQPSSDSTSFNGSGGIGNLSTFYNGYVRLTKGDAGNVTELTSSIEPTLTCVSNDDLYTYINSSKGNTKLANPVGLITADEVIYAGLVVNFSESAKSLTNYLTEGPSYWTMTPYLYNGNNSSVFASGKTGHIGYAHVNFNLSVRPVINLCSDVTFTGNGTQSNPFKVV